MVSWTNLLAVLLSAAGVAAVSVEGRQPAVGLVDHHIIDPMPAFVLSWDMIPGEDSTGTVCDAVSLECLSYSHFAFAVHMVDPLFRPLVVVERAVGKEGYTRVPYPGGEVFFQTHLVGEGNDTQIWCYQYLSNFRMNGTELPGNQVCARVSAVDTSRTGNASGSVPPICRDLTPARLFKPRPTLRGAQWFFGNITVYTFGGVTRSMVHAAFDVATPSISTVLPQGNFTVTICESVSQKTIDPDTCSKMQLPSDKTAMDYARADFLAVFDEIDGQNWQRYHLAIDQMTRWTTICMWVDVQVADELIPMNMTVGRGGFVGLDGKSRCFNWPS